MNLIQNILMKCLLSKIKNKSQNGYILLETIVSVVIISISFFTLTLYSSQIYKNINFFQQQKKIKIIKKKLTSILNNTIQIGSFIDDNFTYHVKKVTKFDENLFEIVISSNDISLKVYK